MSPRPPRKMRAGDIGLPVDPALEAFRAEVRRETLDEVIMAVNRRMEGHKRFGFTRKEKCSATLERHNEGDCIMRLLYVMLRTPA